LGVSRPENAGLAAEKNIALTVFQADWLIKAKGNIAAGRHLATHLKFDSGMGRLGIRSKTELKEIEKEIQTDSRFILEGAYTHFATADELDTSYYEQQLNRFKEMISWLDQ